MVVKSFWDAVLSCTGDLGHIDLTSLFWNVGGIESIRPSKMRLEPMLPAGML